MGEHKAGAGGSAGAIPKGSARAVKQWLAHGRRRRFVVLGISLLLVIAAVALVAVNLRERDGRRTGVTGGPGGGNASQQGDGNPDNGVENTRTDAIDEAVTQRVYAARAERRYDEAVKMLEDYIATSGDDRQKAYAYSQIGALYEVQGDNTRALIAYRQSEAARNGVKDVGIAMGVARTSEAMGDGPTAIKYYRLYVDLLKADNEELDRPDIERVEAKIAELEAAQ